MIVQIKRHARYLSAQHCDEVDLLTKALCHDFSSWDCQHSAAWTLRPFVDRGCRRSSAGCLLRKAHHAWTDRHEEDRHLALIGLWQL